MPKINIKYALLNAQAKAKAKAKVMAVIFATNGLAEFFDRLTFLKRDKNEQIKALLAGFNWCFLFSFSGFLEVFIAWCVFAA